MLSGCLRNRTANKMHEWCTSHAAKILGWQTVSTGLLAQNAEHCSSILRLILWRVVWDDGHAKAVPLRT